MKNITLKTFLSHFCTDIKYDKKFCFILGAGASKSSGIPTGEELVQKWIKELENSYEPDDLKQWMEKENILTTDLGSSYSKIYDKRFELDKKEGFAFLEQLMEGKEPSCGYSILAQILDRKPHKIVITTNFDSLTEDALFIYTQKKPLVIGHESLADYIKPFGARPVIVKIHRDLFFSPKNSMDQIDSLEKNFESNLQTIFKYYTPLVIGYGGNDGSLMGFLERLTETECGIFWFYRKKDGDLKLNIQKIIEKFNGYAIPIEGFDELLIQIGDKLELERLDKQIVEIASRRAKNYREQIELVNKNMTSEKDTKSALSAIVSRGEKDWWYYIFTASKENDPEKKDIIFQKGIQEFPKSPELLSSYALFLKNIKKELNSAEEFHKKAIEIEPKNALSFSNYGSFLADVRKDYGKAEEFHKKAIEIEPKNALILGLYAYFLKNYTKEYDKAEEFNKSAIEIEPKNALSFDTYAVFLADIRKQYDKAEQFHQKAIEIEPKDANLLGNYAKTLIVSEKLVQAKEIILKAFKFNNTYNHNDTLELELWFYCYAIFFKEFPESKKNIEDLLSKGVKSSGWYLKDVLEVAKKRDHPDFEKLSEFERQITNPEN